jgi:hypothetical protein
MFIPRGWYPLKSGDVLLAAPPSSAGGPSSEEWSSPFRPSWGPGWSILRGMFMGKVNFYCALLCTSSPRLSALLRSTSCRRCWCRTTAKLSRVSQPEKPVTSLRTILRGFKKGSQTKNDMYCTGLASQFEDPQPQRMSSPEDFSCVTPTTACRQVWWRRGGCWLSCSCCGVFWLTWSYHLRIWQAHLFRLVDALC